MRSSGNEGRAKSLGGPDEEEEDQYDHFDLDAYASRKEREQSGTLRGDVNSKAPIAKSWLAWNVMVPNLFATFTIALIVAYEVLVVISVFIETVRSVMVVDGLMWALSALNAFACVVLAIIVFMTKKDLSIGQLHGKFLDARPSAASED